MFLKHPYAKYVYAEKSQIQMENSMTKLESFRVE